MYVFVAHSLGYELFCPFATGCDAVQSSPYAQILGIPARCGPHRERGVDRRLSGLAPCRAGYISARWAMRGFNEALRAELYGSGIGVSLVAFAQVSSGFWEHNPGSWERLPAEAHRLRTLTPEDAAVAIADAVERDKRLVLRPRMIYALLAMNTLFPRATERRMWR